MINALFAVDSYGGMGFNGTLPWPHSSEDLSNFKKLTDGHVVVMGRRSWDDPKLPKPLPGRTVYVATNRRIEHATAISGNIVDSILDLEREHPDKIIWVVGGSNILEQCTCLFDHIYLTHHKGSYKVDTKINLKSILVGWHPVRAEVASDFSFTLIKYDNIFKRPAGRTR